MDALGRPPKGLLIYWSGVRVPPGLYLCINGRPRDIQQQRIVRGFGPSADSGFARFLFKLREELAVAGQKVPRGLESPQDLAHLRGFEAADERFHWRAITLTVLGLNLLGDALCDAFDPRQSGR